MYNNFEKKLQSILDVARRNYSEFLINSEIKLKYTYERRDGVVVGIFFLWDLLIIWWVSFLIILCWQRPTLPPKGSTISAEGLNFSVRNGKR